MLLCVYQMILVKPYQRGLDTSQIVVGIIPGVKESAIKAIKCSHEKKMLIQCNKNEGETNNLHFFQNLNFGSFIIYRSWFEAGLYPIFS